MTRPLDLLARLLAPIADARRFTAAVALAFGVTAVGLLAAPPATFAWDANTYSSTSESLLISMQNQARASAGLRSLKLDTALRTVARWRSKDMIDRDYFSHTIKGTDHNVFWYMQYKYGYCFNIAGENIGTVTWPGASEEDATKWVFDAFMNSSGHRANIMGKAWDVVAVGAYKGDGDKFMWTVLFADRCGSTSTPKATPKPTPRPTPRPTPKPTPRPTPRPTKAPAATAAPNPTASPTPEPADAVAPTPFETPTTPPAGPPSDDPQDRPLPPDGVVPPGQYRVVDGGQGTGLIDSILDAIAAQFFGT